MMAESVSSLVGYADSEVSDVPGNEKRGVQPPLSGGVVRLLPKRRRRESYAGGKRRGDADGLAGAGLSPLFRM